MAAPPVHAHPSAQESYEVLEGAIAHRADRVHVVGGVHRDEHLAGRRWRLPDFVAEPSALGER